MGSMKDRPKKFSEIVRTGAIVFVAVPIIMMIASIGIDVYNATHR